jgi:hypothetical protein
MESLLIISIQKNMKIILLIACASYATALTCEPAKFVDPATLKSTAAVCQG